MKIIVQICRIIVGILFIISGFVKIIDPIGMGYKLEEYFSPTVLNLPFLMEFNISIAYILTILEIILGLMLLLGLVRKFTVYALTITIVFFTFLTFYSAYFNKVTDCGCFGDALKLEPWTSFYKDVVLLILILVLVFGQKYIKPILDKKLSWALVLIVFVASSFIANQGINHSPIIDFRAYAVGKDLNLGMKSAEELGKKPSIYRTFYTLENSKTGEIVTIDDNEYVNNDKWYKEGTPWKINTDKTENKLVFKGYEPPIKDFYLDCNGEDKTVEYLAAPKMIFVVIPFADNLNAEKTLAIEKLIHEAEDNQIEIAVLSNHEITKFQNVCVVDQIVLKTMTRSNPGILTLKKGIVSSKYHFNDLPKINQLIQDLN